MTKEKSELESALFLPSITLESLRVDIANCVRCPLSQSRAHAVPGEGPENARIVLVGEAPGKDEDLSGRPFVGRSGKILDECLEEVGINRSEIFITNVVKCRPPENRRPMKAEMEACRPYLHEQIRSIEPRIVCLLGNVATKAVLGKEGVTKLHGQVFQEKFLVTFHPSAVLRNRNLKETFVSDLKRAKGLAEDE